ncbi:MAG: amino acid ABC transporter permease [Propioniciclava sp.]|uniref:amino acid ABC transporter permease n=1 Tax=Propioniciclava sp. TaxID=2038686 RepID=UPI0039E3FAEC
MSVQNVLFDLPGPKARRRYALLAVAGIVAIAGLLAGMLWLLRAEITPERWTPFLNPVVWTAYVLPGLQATLMAAAISVVAAGLLGVLLGMGRLSPRRILSVISGVVVEFFRSVPVLLMMIFAYYFFIYSRVLTGPAASLAGVVTGLTLYNASVIAELVRSGVHALPKGQTEAGLAIGLTRGQTLRMVLLPQAIRAMLPALVSQLVVVLKDTALGYIITYPELLQSAQRISANYGNLIVAYFVIAVIFILINWALAGLADRAERWVANRQAGTVMTTTNESVALVAGMRPVKPIDHIEDEPPR